MCAAAGLSPYVEPGILTGGNSVRREVVVERWKPWSGRQDAALRQARGPLLLLVVSQFAVESTLCADSSSRRLDATELGHSAFLPLDFFRAIRNYPAHATRH